MEEVMQDASEPGSGPSGGGGGGGGGGISVTFDEMESAAGRLITGKEDLVLQLNGLRAFVNHLVSSGFVTEQASSAFQQTYENFTVSATATVESLDGLAGFLSSAAAAMRGTDEALAAQARG